MTLTEELRSYIADYYPTSCTSCHAFFWEITMIGDRSLGRLRDLKLGGGESETPSTLDVWLRCLHCGKNITIEVPYVLQDEAPDSASDIGATE